MSSLTYERAKRYLAYILGNSSTVNVTSRATGRRLHDVLEQYPDFLTVIFDYPRP